MASRRGFLKLIGGGVVLAAGGAGGFVVLNQPSSSARVPWKDAGKETEFRRRALSYALLAPNPHNRQPWLVRLEGENALTLFCDLDRRLPATDPFDRQITIGHGAFLELLVIAAAEDGYVATITPFPDGEDMATLDARAVAHVSFAPSATTPDPLFKHVLARRSNKEAYVPRDVEDDKLTAVMQSAQIFGTVAASTGNTPTAAKLRDLTWRAHKIEVTTHVTNMESVDLMRIGAKEVAANPDGIEFDGPMMSAGKLLGLITKRSLADPTSTGFQQGLDIYQAMAESARGFIWLSNENQTRIDQINVGRAYVRMNLTATSLGLGIHPWSQSLQEYEEMRDLYAEVHDLIGQSRRIQMLVRIGYGPKVGPTPRWPLDTHILT